MIKIRKIRAISTHGDWPHVPFKSAVMGHLGPVIVCAASGLMHWRGGLALADHETSGTAILCLIGDDLGAQVRVPPVSRGVTIVLNGFLRKNLFF